MKGAPYVSPLGKDTWRISANNGWRSDGKRNQVSRTVHGSLEDAIRAQHALEAEIGQSPAIGSHITLDDYFWHIFSPARHSATTKANANTYDSIYRTHISPELGRREVSSITYSQLKSWALRLPPQSAPNYARAIRAILSEAARDGACAKSPFEGARLLLPRRDTFPLPVWGPEEVMEAFSRKEFQDSRLFPLWCCMAGAGLSRSEALALDW